MAHALLPSKYDPICSLCCVATAALVFAGEAHDWSLVPEKRAGPITVTTDRAELVRIFGADQVQDRPFYVAEGFCVPGAVILAGTADEADIAWRDGGPGVAWVRVTQPDGRWVTTAGIRVGTTLAELERLNSGPFMFSGFGWVYGGGIGGWNGGRLDETQGTGIGVRLDADNDAVTMLSREGAVDELFGDQTVRSDHPLARRAGIRVTTLLVRLSAPPDEEPCE